MRSRQADRLPLSLPLRLPNRQAREKPTEGKMARIGSEDSRLRRFVEIRWEILQLDVWPNKLLRTLRVMPLNCVSKKKWPF